MISGTILVAITLTLGRFEHELVEAIASYRMEKVSARRRSDQYVQPIGHPSLNQLIGASRVS
jgi:hypothetical protein